MKKIVFLCFVFQMADMTLLAGLISGDAKFFRDYPSKYWDIPALMQVPRFRANPFPDSDTPGMKSFLVSGKGPDGAEAEFFCTYALPETPKPEKGFPAVMMVHGGGGTAFPHYIDHWRRNGFAVMAIDWYNQRPITNVALSNKHDIARAALPGGKRNDLRANIANIVIANSLLRSMPEVDSSRNVYVGLSWGSWYGAAIAGIDNRYSGIVEIYCGDVRTKKGRELVNGRFLHRATMPVWWTTWTLDRNVTPESSQKGWDECPTYWGHVTSPTLGHSHRGFTLDCVMRMAKFFAGEGPALPRLGKIVLENGVLSAPVTSLGKTTGKAFLVYAEDKGNDIEPSKRIWKHVAAKLEGNRISAPLPAGASIAYLTLNENPSEEIPSSLGGSSHYWFGK